MPTISGPVRSTWSGRAPSVRESRPSSGYALAALSVVPSPIQRWPAIAVDASVPANVFSPAEMVGGCDHLASSCITPSAMTWINKDPRRPEPFALSS
jgi:hypothetical protein